MKCKHVGCRERAEANLDYCRGHEGGFTAPFKGRTEGINRKDLPGIIASSPTKPHEITIALLWTNFAGHVLPGDASAVQREEMKKAFYAGFFECFSVHHDLVANLPDAEAFKVLQRLTDEAQAFYKALGR